MSALQVLPPSIADLVVENYPTIVGVLVVYFAIFAVLSVTAHRRLTSSVSDYVLGSRELGWAVTSFTLFASISSGVGLAGFPGTVYVVGLPFSITVVFGFFVAVSLVWFLGRRIWILGDAHDFTTPGDLLGTYYGSDTVRAYTVVTSLVFNVAYAVAQFTAGGILVHVLSGGIVSTTTGVALVAGLVAVHVVTTGIRGIAWLDTYNGVVMLGTVAIYTAYIFADAGGPAAVIAGLGDAGAAHVSVPGTVGAFTPSYIYGTVVGLLIGIAVMAPAAWLRFYATEDPDGLMNVGAALVVMFMLLHFVGIYWIGSYGRVVFPEVANPDFVSSLLAFEVMPPALAATFLVALLAAIISTTDSYIHTLSATVTRDLGKAVFVPELTDRAEVRLNYAIVGLTTLVSAVLAVRYTGLITALAVFAGGVTVQLLPATLGALVWPRSSTPAALSATGLGIVLTFVWELGLAPSPIAPNVLPGLAVAFLVNLALFVGVSFVTSSRPTATIEAFHGVLHRRLSDGDSEDPTASASD
ncbi:sodium:solute symporter family protein [Haloparvum sp. PAK95]|uniref:sodium:solute symporter family protein n=1 Tax=Haloparvum sp. PAK95 TaxID=3418962 RepID=UPI003D2F47F1